MPDCCHSLACSCKQRSSKMVTGPVDWANPKSVAGSQWFVKYMTKVKTAIQAAAQTKGTSTIEVVAIEGGPVSQLEVRTLPFIISGAVADLVAKGMSVGTPGSGGKITVFMRKMAYADFARRFDEHWMQQTTGKRQFRQVVKHGLLSADDEGASLASRRYCALVEKLDATFSLLYHAGDQPAGETVELPLSSMRISVAGGRLALTLGSSSTAKAITFRPPRAGSEADVQSWADTLVQTKAAAGDASAAFRQSFSRLDRVLPSIKIVVSTVQVLTGMSFACDIAYPPAFAALLEFMKLFVLDIFALVGVYTAQKLCERHKTPGISFITPCADIGCIASSWTFYGKIVTQAVLPPLLIGCIFLMYKRHRARVEGGTTAAEQLANAAAEFIFGVVFLTYPFVEPPSGSVIATPPCISPY